MIKAFSNAIKNSHGKGHSIIEIGSQFVGDEVSYFIKDNVPVFDIRYANNLFDLQRLHSEKEYESTGITLALVQRIVSNMVGEPGPKQ